jgi:hypothetical protein
MELVHFVRHFLLWLKYRRAAIVNSREELEDALARQPPRIVVQGDESLRAYAASLTHRETAAAARLEADQPPLLPGDPPVYMLVPKVGRIRDGLRPVRKVKKVRRAALRGGMDSVLVAAIGIVAALLMEWLSFPDTDPRMIRVPRQHHVGPPPKPPVHFSTVLVQIAIPILGTIAAICLAWLIWQALGLGRPVLTEWRLEQRIQGRVVMARVRRRVR